MLFNQSAQIIEAEEMVRRQFQRKDGNIPPILFCWVPNEKNGRMYRLKPSDKSIKVDQNYVFAALRQLEATGAHHIIAVSTGKIESKGRLDLCVFVLSFTKEIKLLRRAFIKKGNIRNYLSVWETLANQEHPNLWARKSVV